MSYYTERHGMRNPVEKTYTIDLDMYAMLFDCCEKYHDNIAWKYPQECPDGLGCCGLDYAKFNRALKYEIPNLFRNYQGYIDKPSKGWDDEPEQYDQFSLLDYIEFIAQNCRDVEIGSFHSYFNHNHLKCQRTEEIYDTFQAEINDIFIKTGLLYKLTDEKIIERIVQNSPLTLELQAEVLKVKEKGTRELLQDAITLYKQPYSESNKDAVEKLWQAFERLKTYYTEKGKSDSADKIVGDMAGGQDYYFKMFDTEFRTLTNIGNDIRIRHHETNRVEITDNRYYDYFFNRCLSLVALAVQYLE